MHPPLISPIKNELKIYIYIYIYISYYFQKTFIIINTFWLMSSTV
jgi:hypothetical protein